MGYDVARDLWHHPKDGCLLGLKVMEKVLSEG